jgi:hypothetical protein
MESSYETKSGVGMKHEVKEAYLGAKMSQETNYSAPNAFYDRSFYLKAHEAASKIVAQPGPVYQSPDGKYFLRMEGKPDMDL